MSNSRSTNKCGQELENQCYSNLFNNPQEDNIPPQALPRNRSEQASRLSVQRAVSDNSSTTVTRNISRETASDLPLVTEGFLEMEFVESESQTTNTSQPQTMQTDIQTAPADGETKGVSSETPTDLSSNQSPPVQEPQISELAAQVKNPETHQDPVNTQRKSSDRRVAETAQSTQKEAPEDNNGLSKIKPVQAASKRTQASDNLSDPLNIAEQPSTPQTTKKVSGDPSKIKPIQAASKRTQAPDNLSDPPIIAQQPSAPQTTKKVSDDPSNIKPVQAPSKHTQAPDDVNDPPIIAKPPSVPQKTEKIPTNDPSKLKPVQAPSKHTQAPDDINDPPIITEQPAAMPQETEKIPIFNPNIMPAWAEEFLATRCGKSPCEGSTQPKETLPPSYYTFICGSLYGNSRFCSEQVYFSRCCETGRSRYYAGVLAGNSYCKELLNKYRNPPVNLQADEKTGNPAEAPNSSETKPVAPNPTKADVDPQAKVDSDPNATSDDDEPGCCKTCCCIACCCTYYSWMFWLILLILLMMLLFLIWWKECGTVVLILKEITDWPNFPNYFIRDIIGVTKEMRLFLSTLGYFAYFMLICFCYTCCKKCTIPDDPKGCCSCKEIKLLIHIVYGVVLLIFLHNAVWDEWPNDKRKYGRNRKKDHILDCLELCFWFTCVLLIVGVIAFVIYSLERRKIRKRIAPEFTFEENPANNPQQQITTAAAAKTTNVANKLASVPAPALLHSICAEHVRPIFQPQRKTYSQYNGFCQERFQSIRTMNSPCRPWRYKVNETFSC